MESTQLLVKKLSNGKTFSTLELADYSNLSEQGVQMAISQMNLNKKKWKDVQILNVGKYGNGLYKIEMKGTATDDILRSIDKKTKHVISQVRTRINPMENIGMKTRSEKEKLQLAKALSQSNGELIQNVSLALLNS